ncbi:MAG: hypothetical protein J6Z14_10655 [Prevotella sp.]|nr:hypothetical protein [Prevotella sp.]
MKKIFLLATAIAALASCADESFIGDEALRQANEQTEKPIVFSTGVNAVTRATYTESAAAGKLNNNFVVEGVKWNGGSDTKVTVFDNYNVNYADNTANSTESNSSGWEYVNQTKHDNATVGEQTIKYWDYAKSQYDFIAYSLGTASFTSETTIPSGSLKVSAIDATKMNGVETSSVITDGAYTIEGAAADLKKAYIADLATAYRDDSPSGYQQTVQFSFRSLAAKVRIALYETIPGYSVKDVVFYTDASTVATDSKAHLYLTGSDVFNAAGKYIVYFPTTGNSNKTQTDYNKAHVQFEAASSGGTATGLDLGTLANYADRERHEKSENVYLGRASNAATFADASTSDNTDNYYTVVLPNEAGAVLNLKVNYTLLSTDNSGETISVTGASAQVPAAFAAWKPGYAYTYIFKISDETNNGFTDPSHGPAGLYPITFDAVVTESEDGMQETITTVAEPSITTYAKGAIVGSHDEYTTGSNIYVVVANGTALTVDTNAKLYSVSQSNTKSSGDAGYHDAAAQPITEATVANILKNGDNTTDPTKWTDIDANNWKMEVTTASVPTLTAVTEIAAADSPTGNAITVNGAKFTPTDVGTYVFEYIKAAEGTPYVAATGTYVAGTKYYTDNTGATEVDTSGFTAGTTDVSSLFVENSSYSPEAKYYKVIKVVAP